MTLEAPVRASRAGRRPASSTAVTSLDAERAVGPALDPAPLRHPGPGQQVGVVLDHRGHHDVVGLELQPVGQMVDGLGGVAAAAPRRCRRRSAARRSGARSSRAALVGGRGAAGLVPGAPVHARVPREELGHRVGHHLHAPASRRRSRGRGRDARCRRGRGRARPAPTRPTAGGRDSDGHRATG